MVGTVLPKVEPVPTPVWPKPVKGVVVVVPPKLKPVGFAAVVEPNSPPVVFVPAVPNAGVLPKPVLPNAGVLPVPKDGVVLVAPKRLPVDVPKPVVLVAPNAGVVAPKENWDGCLAPNNDVPVLAVLPNPKPEGADVVAAPNVGLTPKALGCVVAPNVVPKPVPNPVEGCVVAVVLPKSVVPAGWPNRDFCCG